MESAENALENEQDTVFIPFWEWRVKITQKELEEQEEEAKEEQQTV
ncbi:MAG: hypothetical protein OXC40_00565 [Proteobacteria bacterium]|nr:hypothetical protein [Pseudomonadota bacterium]